MLHCIPSKMAPWESRVFRRQAGPTSKTHGTVDDVDDDGISWTTTTPELLAV